MISRPYPARHSLPDSSTAEVELSVTRRLARSPDRSYHADHLGEVTEWPIVLVSKTSVLQGTVGSNPTLSAPLQSDRRNLMIALLLR